MLSEGRSWRHDVPSAVVNHHHESNMKQQQIELVQKTFEKRVQPIATEAGQMMYTHLFQMDPSLRPLFKGDIKRQGEMLMTAIGLAVKGLEEPEEVRQASVALGKRHAGYGVKPSFFNVFGASLMWTLEQVIGPDFTPEVKEAWGETYALLAKTMQEVTHE